MNKAKIKREERTKEKNLGVKSLTQDLTKTQYKKKITVIFQLHWKAVFKLLRKSRNPNVSVFVLCFAWTLS